MAPGEPAFSMRTRRPRRVLSSGALPLALVALAGPSLTMNPPGKSRAWVAMHWAIAISPFVLVLALSIWGYDKYAWIPLVAAVLCPVGAALVGLRVAADRKQRQRG